MHILVDGTMVKPRQAGIRTYALELTRALSALDGVRVTVAVADGVNESWGGAKAVSTNLRFRDPVRRISWRHLNVPRIARHLRADALLVPAPEPVRSPGLPQAVVVHDLGPLLAPGIYGRRRFASYLATIRSTIERSTAVFTPSFSTREDALRWVGLDAAEKIHVAGPVMTGGSPQRVTMDSDRWRSGFALYPGALLPHKNVATVAEAFAHPAEGMPRELRVIGPTYGDEVAEFTNRFGGISSVRHLGFVSEQERDALYAAASCTVFPSLFEGFGIPVAEALTQGTAVIASDIPAVREVGGPDVTTVSRPTDPDAWRAALSQPRPRPSVAPRLTWTPAAEAVHSVLSKHLQNRRTHT